MIVNEKTGNNFNILELLLHLKKMPELALNEKRDVPAEWKSIMSGKVVILFYIGHIAFNKLHNNVNSICGMINYVQRIVEGSAGFLLLWLDDGGLLQKVQETAKVDAGDSNTGDYDELVKSFESSEHTFRINLIDLDNLIKYVDVYYGEEGKLFDIAKSSGKMICLQSVERQNANPSASITRWLGEIAGQHKDCEINLPKEEERKIVLYDMQPQSLLIHAEKAVAKLERVVSMAATRKELHFFWAEENIIMDILELLPTERKNRYLSARDKFNEFGTVLRISSIFNNISGRYDIYYGDNSSLYNESIHRRIPVITQWYGQWANKPNPFIHSDYGFSLKFTMSCFVGAYRYFTLHNGNALCRVKKSDTKVEFLSFIPCTMSDGNKNFLFSNIACYQNKLFLLPLLTNEIMVYEIATGEWRSLPLSEKYTLPKHNKGRLGSGIQQGKMLWGIPVSYMAIVGIDMEQETLSYYSDWSSCLLPYVTIVSSMHWSGAAVLTNNKIWFGASQSTHLVSFDISSKKSTIYQLDIEAQGFNNIAFDGNDFWLSTIRKGAGTVIKWHPRKSIELVLKEFVGEGEIPCAICAVGEDIWGFVPYVDSYVRYNIRTNKKVYVEHYLPKNMFSGSVGSSALMLQDKYIYICPVFGDLLIEINAETGAVNAQSFHFTKESMIKYLCYNMPGNKFNESDFYDDDEMLTYLEYFKYTNGGLVTNGEKIYREIMNCFRAL